MAKLEDFTKTAGMNGGTVVYAKMMRVSDILTDPELAGLFPVQEGTLAAVIQSMKETGYDRAEPLVLWKGKNIVIDGHTRFAAAREAEIQEVPVEEKEFESLEDAMLYAYGRQANRRNLTQAEIFKAATTLETKVSRDGSGRSAELLAKKLGISKTTVYNARAVGESGNEEVIESVKKGDISIKKAYQQVKDKKQKSRQPQRIRENAEDGSFEEDIEEEALSEASGVLETDTDFNDSSPLGDGGENLHLRIAHAISAVENFLSANREEELQDIEELHRALDILVNIRAA